MVKFRVGDFVVLKRDNNVKKRVFKVLAVSEIYDAVKLVDSFAPQSLSAPYANSFWLPCGSVRKVSFYQPELIAGVN